MFVDASAIVAILTREPEADALADLLEAARAPITSPIALFEAALGICRKRHASVEEAEEDVREFLKVAAIEVIPITAKEGRDGARRVFSLWKGRSHPAQLNLGDCFAYAAAKNHRRALLFKGDDFDQDRDPGSKPNLVALRYDFVRVALAESWHRTGFATARDACPMVSGIGPRRRSKPSGSLLLRLVAQQLRPFS